eukprot:TRINITY_DN426_c0_g1_i7.p1 TRINITY_DN426_c0_g1~~TRINITY_DN426_c0_g1_i7.p1  ORF type:complete len:354 (-),score=41.68 TRINITY_DN426_c0_g1_i7:175-1236(-)
MAQRCNCRINPNNTQQRDHDLSCVQRKITWNDLFNLENKQHIKVKEWLVEEGYEPEDLLRKKDAEINNLENPPFLRGIKERIIQFKNRCGQRFSDPPSQNQPPINQGISKTPPRQNPRNKSGSDPYLPRGASPLKEQTRDQISKLSSSPKWDEVKVKKYLISHIERVEQIPNFVRFFSHCSDSVPDYILRAATLSPQDPTSALIIEHCKKSEPRPFANGQPVAIEGVDIKGVCYRDTSDYWKPLLYDVYPRAELLVGATESAWRSYFFSRFDDIIFKSSILSVESNSDYSDSPMNVKTDLTIGAVQEVIDKRKCVTTQRLSFGLADVEEKKNMDVNPDECKLICEMKPIIFFG